MPAIHDEVLGHMQAQMQAFQVELHGMSQKLGRVEGCVDALAARQKEFHDDLREDIEKLHARVNSMRICPMHEGHETRLRTVEGFIERGRGIMYLVATLIGAAVSLAVSLITSHFSRR
jgi:hypothetical protein